MNKLIHQINSAVRGVDKLATDSIRQSGVGKLPMSPVPVPYPRSAIGRGSTHYQIPLSLTLASDPSSTFRLPVDPVISISGGNSVVCREIADKQIRGTIKELWRRNDWGINISGMLMSDEEGSCEYYMRRLAELCAADENLIIDCAVVNDVLGCTQIAVTALDFPATSGVDNQMFVVKAVSDDSYRLEVE